MHKVLLLRLQHGSPLKGSIMADESWWTDPAQLDDEQTDVIALPPEGSFLVTGPPGSGKTNLLLLRASYLVDSQMPNVAVLMFTSSLRDFVVRGSGNYSFSEDKVQTIMSWERRLIREHSGDLPADDGKFAERRLAHAKEVAAIFDRKPALEHHLDCILVDEVQDCLPEEIELFFRAARYVFFVGDHRQEIYAKSAILDMVKGRVECKALTKHYRSGVAIWRVADAIGRNFGEPPLLGSCNYDETKDKSSVTFEACQDDAEVFQKLAARLTQQLKAYPEELLGVACPRNEDLDKVRVALGAIPHLASSLLGHGMLRNADNVHQRIYLCTMHDAKGLEFRAMHLPFAEYLKKMGETQKKLAYTSITRAKTSQAVYHVKPLPGYVEQARDKNAPPKPPPKMTDLFSGKKK